MLCQAMTWHSSLLKNNSLQNKIAQEPGILTEHPWPSLWSALPPAGLAKLLVGERAHPRNSLGGAEHWCPESTPFLKINRDKLLELAQGGDLQPASRFYLRICVLAADVRNEPIQINFLRRSLGNVQIPKIWRVLIPTPILCSPFNLFLKGKICSNLESCPGIQRPLIPGQNPFGSRFPVCLDQAQP